MNGKALLARPPPRGTSSDQGGSTREEVADAYDVSVSSLNRFLRRWCATGSVTPAKFGGHKRYALEGHEQQIKQWT